MDWDARMLGLTVGRLMQGNGGPESAELDAYDLVLARVSQEQRDTVARLENQGFRYVGLDVVLERELTQTARRPTGSADWSIHHIRHASPDFEIQGFQIEDSRFMLDARCREQLPVDFWDRVALDHCENFADTVICAVDSRKCLCGFISCLEKSQFLDMFLVAVHPNCQNQGLGGLLVCEAISLADQMNLPVCTSVMASNTRGFNFYLKHHFLVKSGEIIMHRWREGAVHAY